MHSYLRCARYVVSLWRSAAYTCTPPRSQLPEWRPVASVTTVGSRLTNPPRADSEHIRRSSSKQLLGRYVVCYDVLHRYL